jgi:chromosome segregation ATPase
MEEQNQAHLSEIDSLKKAEIANKKVNDALSAETIKLEKERDKFSKEAAKANSNLLQMLEEVKLKRNLIGELKKENLDLESKLKTQQNLYEAVRADRNLYSKNLIEAQDQVSELKRKFRIASHSINQLKEEITAKDTALVTSQHDLGTEKKKSEQNKVEMIQEKQKKEQLESQVEQYKMQEKKLTFIIKEAYQEHEKKQKEITQLKATRDALGTQLIRRNDELALLYEKIKILQTTLNKGEAQYQQRI